MIGPTHTRHQYDRQAETYDRTRAASPSVLGPLLAALGGAGSALGIVDIGGGTGNYAAAVSDAGHQSTVIDFNADMLARSKAKGLGVVRADAAQLPLADASADASMFVSMLHHVVGWETALHEGQRVVRSGGRVVLMAFAREHLAVHWVTGYFPQTTAHFAAGHQSLAQLADALPGASVTPIFYEDLVDRSMAAMCRRPETLLDPDVRRQTSFFERAATDHPDELAAGLARLEMDLANGRRPQDENATRRATLGDAAVWTWFKP